LGERANVKVKTEAGGMVKCANAHDLRRSFSERTRSALATAKRRGAKLGASNPKCRNLTDEARRRGAKAGKELRAEMLKQ
jgi:hypothetical protein